MQQRFVFLHYHLVMNAGATIDTILARAFHEDFDALHEPIGKGIVSNDEIIRFLQHNPTTQALSSWHFRLPAPTHPQLRFMTIGLVRHPMDRLQAMYHQYRCGLAPAERRSGSARELSLVEWLKWMMEAEPFTVLNAQTSFFGRVRSAAVPAGDEHLAQAKEAVTDLKVLGVVERLNESLVTAEHFLRVTFPVLDLSYVSHDTHAEREIDLGERLGERMQDVCGANFYDRLRLCNELDEELWEWAHQELDRRLAYVPDATERLRRFRARCSQLDSAADTLASIDTLGTR
jgi:hypothetical protein